MAPPQGGPSDLICSVPVLSDPDLSDHAISVEGDYERHPTAAEVLEPRGARPTRRDLKRVELGRADPELTAQVMLTFNAWNEECTARGIGKGFLAPSSSLPEWKAIVERITVEKLDPAMVAAAARGIFLDDWRKGRRRALSLMNAVKSHDAVTDFAELARAPPKPPEPEEPTELPEYLRKEKRFN